MKRKLYGNCRVYHPDGELMFLCLEKKLNWYLSRDLAVEITHDPLTGDEINSPAIQLTFQPKGKGAGSTEEQKEYYLSPKKNCCVVCGTEDTTKLTKHHVVPSEYRSHFPNERKNRSSHDIVVICERDHARYENRYATPLKIRLEKELGLEIKHHNVAEYYKVYNMSLIFLDLEKMKSIPENRLEHFKSEMKRLYGTDDPYEVSQTDFHIKLKEELANTSKKVVESLNSIEDFIIMWRSHFLEKMKPKYMPEKWSVYHNTSKENEKSTITE